MCIFILGDALFCPTIEVPRPEYLKVDEAFVGKPVYCDGHVCCLMASLSKDQNGNDVLAVAVKLAALRSHWNVEKALCILWVVTDNGPIGVTSADINIGNCYDAQHNCFIVSVIYFEFEVSDHPHLQYKASCQTKSEAKRWKNLDLVGRC